MPTTPHYNLSRTAYCLLAEPAQLIDALPHSLLPNSPPLGHHLQVAMVLLPLNKEDIRRNKDKKLAPTYVSRSPVFIVQFCSSSNLNAEPCYLYPSSLAKANIRLMPVPLRQVAYTISSPLALSSLVTVPLRFLTIFPSHLASKSQQSVRLES